MPSLRRRLTTSLATLAVLAGSGGLCWWGAQAAATFIETRSAAEVDETLSRAGLDWVEVATDGLLVELSGTAPSELDRFRATTEAASVVDPSRIRDAMSVAALEAMTPPEFKLELLRGDQGISLIGLVPVATDRTALTRSLRLETAAPQITDLMESADYPVPPGWNEALRLGLRAAQALANAKISVTPGAVHVTALADSEAERSRLETLLRRATPDGVTLTAEISAPRPVIAPFLLRFVIDENGPRFDNCAADDEAARQLILDAARQAGMTGNTSCTLGLGAPSAEWGQAAALSIAALADLGAGSVTLSDGDIALHVPASVDRQALDRAVAALQAELPPTFALIAHRDQDDEAARIEFQATLTEGGSVSIRGVIADTRMREAVDSFARSRFAVTQTALRNDEAVPGGWTVRVIAAIEAMDVLHSGQVRVTPDLVTLTGISGDAEATRRASGILSQRLGAGARYELSIRYDRRLDESLGLPDGDECVARLNRVMQESEIGFEPARASIAGDPEPTLAQLAAIMADCADFQIEAGGHTDSQGSEAFNADLSRARAQAILTAMAEAGIDVTHMTARGYGESQPIASNETEEGREANRRIEFRLLSARPVQNAPLPAPVTVSGVTRDVTEIPPETERKGPERSVDAEPLPPVMGPPMPPAERSGLSVSTLGASEEFQTLKEREENIRVPVLTPEADTPRPSPRPAAASGAPAEEDSDA
ncbi:OmpA family protein [Paracoccus bogoriensis]|uniref:OmpA family protein n=1 Tax=Paracoccus bogoriensis TaxID=242065 RepID=UPI001CA5F246|nr:OmpA family protein [Paracoccus bogoriensis]MBW7055265.1 OmpA family protein [Paracoccus bogoriensis]